MSDRLTPEREAEIAARAAAATPGPWEEHEKYGRNFFAYLGGPYLRGVGTLNFGEGDDADADRALTVNAQADITALLAELAAVRKERDQARRDAELQRAAYFHEAARLLEDAGRDDDAVNLLDNVANGIRANVDAIEAARNAIRRSYTGLIAQAEQDRDPEGAAHLQAQLRDREAQWKRDDEAGESR